MLSSGPHFLCLHLLSFFQKGVELVCRYPVLLLERMGVYVHRRGRLGVAQHFADVDNVHIQIVQEGSARMPQPM